MGEFHLKLVLQILLCNITFLLHVLVQKLLKFGAPKVTLLQ